jgi:hypothetical protein
MEKEFITYEQALALKELGFDEPCFMTYLNGKLDKEIFLFNHSIRSHSTQEFISAPLYQQVFRWFREKHNLHNGIYPYYDEYEFQIKDFRLPTNTPINGGLMKYEEAELACLIKLIEIVKSK